MGLAIFTDATQLSSSPGQAGLVSCRKIHLLKDLIKDLLKYLLKDLLKDLLQRLLEYLLYDQRELGKGKDLGWADWDL